MAIQRITAIVPIDMVEPLEKNLRACGVPGITVEHVQGYGFTGARTYGNAFGKR